EHMLVLLVVGTFIIERCLYQFRKIPFTCSYLPGKSNLTITVGIYMIVLLLIAEVGTQLEYFMLLRFARFVVFFTIILAITLWIRRRTRDYTASPFTRLQFEDTPPSEV